MVNRKSAKISEAKGLTTILGMLQGNKTIFSGFKLGRLKVGDKAVVLGKGISMKGHEPQAKFAQLSDGSKITLTGKNKGLIIK